MKGKLIYDKGWRRVPLQQVCEVIPLDPEVARKQANRAERKRLREKLKAVPACCGTCRNIQFHGINEIHMISGGCRRYHDSGRPYVMFDETPCKFYKPAGLTLISLRLATTRRKPVKASTNAEAM